MKKVLVIDDDQGLLAILKKRLDGDQFEVITATDGAEGLQLVKEEKPDIILLDVGLPNMDGYSVVRELEQLNAGQTLPIIIMTGKEETQELFKIEGINNFLLKPFDYADLKKVIDKVLVS